MVGDIKKCIYSKISTQPNHHIFSQVTQKDKYKYTNQYQCKYKYRYWCVLLQVRALFSATLPEGVEEMASSVLQSPLRLTVGPRNAPTSAVAQRLMFVGREGGKMLGLRQLVAQGLTPPVLLFVSSKERAEAVHR